MHESLWVWLGFNLFILLAIVIDLFIVHRDAKVISSKKALWVSAIWIGLALLFNYGIFIYRGKEAALNFLTGYLIEKALSVDNLFVFLVIFNYFQTPRQYHYKVLFWGVLGAIVMRAGFIFFGITLIQAFHWILYIFGLFLIYAGIKMALPKDKEIHPEQNPVLKLIKKIFPLTPNYRDEHFFVRQSGRLWATPLFIVLMTVETTDLIFALDSIPAVIAITRDPFIIYTSNIFAILGLRSLYFALAGALALFHYLNYGLAFILTFVGLKMLLEPFIEIPILIALGVIVVTLLLTIAASIAFTKRDKKLP